MPKYVKDRFELIQISLMIFISILSQVVSLGKSSILAAQFGAHADIDAYNVVMSLTTFVFSFLATGITTVLIPAFVRKVDSKTINTFLTTIYTFSIFISIVLIVFNGFVFGFFSNGNPAFMRTTHDILLILLVSQFFNTYLGVATAYFQVINKYNFPKVVTLLTSILLIGCMLFDSGMTIFRLSLYTAATTLINAAVQSYYAKKSGFTPRLAFRFNSEPYREMMRAYLPTVFSAGLYQLNLMMDSLISAKTGVGNISILSYANSLTGMINSVLIANILVYLYPKITQLLVQNVTLAKRRLIDSMYVVNTLVAVMLIAFFGFGKTALQLLLQHGKFGAEDLSLLFNCTAIFMVGFPFNVTRDLLYRYFYAVGDTRRTFYNSATASIVNLVVSILLAIKIGMYGVILGTVISSIISLMSIFWRYCHVYGMEYNGTKFLLEVSKIFVPCLTLSAIGMILTRALGRGAFTDFIITCCMLVVYLLSLYLTKSEALVFLKGFKK